jgi:hypothetical protein
VLAFSWAAVPQPADWGPHIRPSSFLRLRLPEHVELPHPRRHAQLLALAGLPSLDRRLRRLLVCLGPLVVPNLVGFLLLLLQGVSKRLGIALIWDCVALRLTM